MNGGLGIGHGAAGDVDRHTLGQKGEGNSIQYFLSTTFNYPTMAEAYRVAALDGMNRINRR